ncbi:hypothetical protein AGMMS4956_01680 [Bacteroidia bacterium]|nr:hypothetical protein AGMMS4956_01680 [Bacteroidia bacterium]
MNTTLSTQATPESVWAILQETAQLQKEYKERQEKDAAEARERWKKLEEFQAKVSQDIVNMGRNLGGLNNRIGEIMETLLAGRMWEKFKDYNYDFERAYQRVGIYNGSARLTDVDILLSNGKYAMAVEVKNTLNRIADVDDHLDRMEKLMLYPPAEIKGKKVLGAMACGVLDTDVSDYAFNKGLFVMELTGDAADLTPPPANFTPQEWTPR